MIKTLIRKAIETIKRSLHKDNLFKVRNYRFYLPNKGDYIQSQMIVKNKFYEEEILKELKTLGENLNIIDIGANIGNHSMYFAGEMKANVVFAIEPQVDVFDILEKNIELNNVKRKIFALNIALGEKPGKFVGHREDKSNTGTYTLKENEKGLGVIGTLDVLDSKLDLIDYTFNNSPAWKIDLIKIDVEGYELQVLKGGLKTIEKYKPVLVLEISSEQQLKEISSLLPNYTFRKIAPVEYIGTTQ